jgi:hypothetical protein
MSYPYVFIIASKFSKIDILQQIADTATLDISILPDFLVHFFLGLTAQTPENISVQH